MHLIKPGWKTLRMGITPWEKVDGLEVLKVLEEGGRECYQSEGAATDDSAIPFMKRRLSGKIKNTAILDHLYITARYICDRGISHEWLRHKLTEILPEGCVQELDDFAPMAVMMESTRYCNYMKSGGVCFVIPPWVNIPEGEYNLLNTSIEFVDKLNITERLWLSNRFHSENTYLELLKEGWTPQMARGDLLIGVKTAFRVTCSLTEWRYVMSLRTDSAAHPQMKELMRPQLDDFKKKIPVIFDDIIYEKEK